MSRVLVLGGSGEMGSAAVADLVERTDHEVTVGDIRPEAAAALLAASAHRSASSRVDVEDPASLAAALADTEVVLNATYMRHNVRVTDAAIAAGVHLVDLGSYYPGDARAARAARPSCGGRLPDRARLWRRARPDQHPRPARRDALDAVDAVRIYSYITHPMWTSPGIVVTRFDASTGTSLVLEDGRLVEQPSFSGDETIVFPEPYGDQTVHLVPHPEPVTLPRSIDVRNVVFKVGYPADETRASRRCSSSASTATRRSSSMASRSRRAGSPPRISAAAGSARPTAAPTSSRSAWTASATGRP